MQSQSKQIAKMKDQVLNLELQVEKLQSHIAYMLDFIKIQNGMIKDIYKKAMPKED